MKRVLLVDDDADILDSLSFVLSDTYDISVARNGARALDLLLQSPFDAVVLDLMMPVLDGAALMRELDSRGVRVPIILASASTDLAHQRQVLGAADAVAKPFPVHELEDKLARVLADGGGSAGASGAGGPGGAPPGSAGGDGGTQAHAFSAPLSGFAPGVPGRRGTSRARGSARTRATGGSSTSAHGA